jgi:hypothetical protein
MGVDVSDTELVPHVAEPEVLPAQPQQPGEVWLIRTPYGLDVGRFLRDETNNGWDTLGDERGWYAPEVQPIRRLLAAGWDDE